MAIRAPDGAKKEVICKTSRSISRQEGSLPMKPGCPINSSTQAVL